MGITKSMKGAQIALDKGVRKIGDVNFDFGNFDAVTPEYKQNNYNLTMPTTANAGDVKMAFELMEAWGT